jgi:hypothetical protein
MEDNTAYYIKDSDLGIITFYKKGIIKEESLLKKGGLLRGWKEKWIVLTRTHLVTFKERCVYVDPTNIIRIGDL